MEFNIFSLGLDTVINLFSGFKSNMTSTLSKGAERIGVRLEALIKKATPVDTGNLRSSITTRTNGMQTVVGSDVVYAQFVEYGTKRMEARHVEGGQKRILGVGPFAYGVSQLEAGVANQEKEIAKDIENRFASQLERGFKPTQPNLPFF